MKRGGPLKLVKWLGMWRTKMLVIILIIHMKRMWIIYHKKNTRANCSKRESSSEVEIEDMEGKRSTTTPMNKATEPIATLSHQNLHVVHECPMGPKDFPWVDDAFCSQTESHYCVCLSPV